MRRGLVVLLALVALLGASIPVSAAPSGKQVGINVVLNTPVSNNLLADLGKYGKVGDVTYQINALTMRVTESSLPAIQALPYVAAANPDAERKGAPVTAMAADNFAGGMNTWDMDAMNVTDLDVGRTLLDYDGAGVYVAVLDTGLVDNWRYYFPEARIATQYAKTFGGGGGEMGYVSEQPNKWEHDQNSHGTHVTSTILGFNYMGTAVNGVAPRATVIPVKVLNQNGSGWSSVVAQGITYVGDLKRGPLNAYPVVINMSLGGPELDAMEKKAIDYAIAQGVIIVAAAGNEGEAGMGYPGAYEPVISVAATGWAGEWGGAAAVGQPLNRAWWYELDVPDPNVPGNFYMTDFSSRQKANQDLDVAAPGSWVLGPYQTNGQLSYYYLGGTSMASPHVAGLVALMAQKHPALTAADAESILEATALPLAPGSMDVFDPSFRTMVPMAWGADATGSGLVNAPAALNATP